MPFIRMQYADSNEIIIYFVGSTSPWKKEALNTTYSTLIICIYQYMLKKIVTYTKPLFLNGIANLMTPKRSF